MLGSVEQVFDPHTQSHYYGLRKLDNTVAVKKKKDVTCNSNISAAKQT